MSPEEYCNCNALYSAITCHIECLVICHEASPTWRNNVLRGAPHLLALRLSYLHKNNLLIFRLCLCVIFKFSGMSWMKVVTSTK